MGHRCTLSRQCSTRQTQDRNLIQAAVQEPALVIARLLTTPSSLPWCARSQYTVPLADGGATTLHVSEYDRATTRVCVVALERPMRLVDWCRAEGVSDAIVGGFFVRPDGAPLGELWIAGRRVASTPFDAPWDMARACVSIEGDRLRVARRSELDFVPRGDLLQAGPLLVRDGRPVVGDDAEGFSAGARQFDSDITLGRYPRAALALCHSLAAGDRLLAVTCDGRSETDAGLTLRELAGALVGLGAEAAINLDGGGSASLVSGFSLLNRPREDHGIELAGGRPVATALAFLPC
jgi:Phosphodiester glycosidase